MLIVGKELIFFSFCFCLCEMGSMTFFDEYVDVNLTSKKIAQN